MAKHIFYILCLIHCLWPKKEIWICRYKYVLATDKGDFILFLSNYYKQDCMATNWTNAGFLLFCVDWETALHSALWACYSMDRRDIFWKTLKKKKKIHCLHCTILVFFFFSPHLFYRSVCLAQLRHLFLQ